jgi:hypothetical protein
VATANTASTWKSRPCRSHVGSAPAPAKPPLDRRGRWAPASTRPRRRHRYPQRPYQSRLSPLIVDQPYGPA